MHFKSNILFSGDKSLNVDRENGIIKNVCIVQFGANKNGSYFSEKYLQDFAKGANEINQGVKSRYGHPNMCSTTLGKFIGRYKNFSFGVNETNQKPTVFAELHLDNITKKTQVEGQGISMFEYITDMAENNPDVFGNSIHIPVPKFEKDLVEVDKKKYQSHIFNGVVASDLVDSPAATDSLFSDTDDLGITVTQFLDENPSIFEAITKKPDIIINFFETYENYLNNYKSNINMKFLDKLKKTFSTDETFDIEETLADGEIVKIATEDENPKVGDPVTKEDGTSIADGDVTIKDGTVWVIEGGKISEIKPKEEEEAGAGDEPTNAEVMQSISDLGKTFSAFQTQYAKDVKGNEEAIEFVATTFEKKFSNLAKTVKSNSPDYEIDPSTGKTKKFSKSGGYDPDKAREERDKRNPKNN